MNLLILLPPLRCHYEGNLESGSQKKALGAGLAKGHDRGPKNPEVSQHFLMAKLSNIKGEETPKTRPSIVRTSAEKPCESSNSSSGEVEDKGEDFIPMKARQKRS